MPVMESATLVCHFSACFCFFAGQQPCYASHQHLGSALCFTVMCSDVKGIAGEQTLAQHAHSVKIGFGFSGLAHLVAPHALQCHWVWGLRETAPADGAIWSALHAQQGEATCKDNLLSRLSEAVQAGAIMRSETWLAHRI